MAVNTGKMRHRVQLQTASTTTDTYGERKNEYTEGEWSTVATRWAFVKPLQGRELEQARQLKTEITHSVTLRFYEGLSPLYRFIHDGRQLQIISVINENESNHWHICQCVERQI